MQAAFHHHLLFFSQSLNPPIKTPKLFLPSSSATPHRHRSINHPNSISSTASTALNDYQLLFSSQPAEPTEPLPLLATEGALPPDFPLGTYYLNGPGMIADGSGQAVSPLDGHGYLRAFRFIGGGVVMYSARYVETEAAREERDEETGEWRFRRPGLFSMFKSHWTSPVGNMLKNVANTTVLRWGGRLFCFWEGGRPYELEPKSLATIGMVDFITMAKGQPSGGDSGAGNIAAEIAKPLIHLMLGKPPNRTLSHYKIDVQRNRLLILCCDTEDICLPQANFTFYEFDSKFQLKKKKKFVIPDQLLTHDWAFTDSHYIILGNRIKLDLAGSLLAVASLAPAISTVSLNPNKTTTPIYLLPRDSDDTVPPRRDWRIPIEAPSQLWTSHLGNAYQERDNAGNMKINIQASVCSYQWFNFKKLFGYVRHSSKLDPSFMNAENQALPHLVQLSIELDARGSCYRCSIADSSNNWRKSSDFPVINPANSGKRNRFMYASSASGSTEYLPHFPFDTVVKIDCSNGMVKCWRAQSRSFIGEPMFVSRKTKDEEDGYIVLIEYAVSRHKCCLVVLDAKRIGYDDAVVAKLEVPEYLSFPFGFHGFWAGNYRSFLASTSLKSELYTDQKIGSAKKLKQALFDL